VTREVKEVEAEVRAHGTTRCSQELHECHARDDLSTSSLRMYNLIQANMSLRLATMARLQVRNTLTRQSTILQRRFESTYQPPNTTPKSSNMHVRVVVLARAST